MYAVTLAVPQEQSGVGHVIRGLPHDPASIAVYALLVVVVFFLWYGNRPHGEGPGDGGGDAGGS